MTQMTALPRTAQIDRDVLEILQHKNCNYAQVYIVWVTVFSQRDIPLTTIHAHLQHHFEWAPSYKTFRVTVMPTIRKVIAEVLERKPRPISG